MATKVIETLTWKGKLFQLKTKELPDEGRTSWGVIVQIPGNGASTGRWWKTEQEARTCLRVWTMDEGPERDALVASMKW